MAGAPPARGGGLVLIGALSTAAFSHGLMQSFLNPLLPTLGLAFGVDQGSIAWLVTGFLLASSIAMPIAGRLGDMFGRARVLRIVMLTFLAGTILAAVADAYAVLLVARIVQGAAGAMFPLAFGLLRERLSERAMVAGIGLVSSMIAASSAIAVVAVGPLVDAAGLRGVFVIAAVVAAIATVLVWALVPRADVAARRGSVDVIGAVLMAIWLAGLLLSVTQGAAWGWTAPVTLVLMLITVVGFLIWVRAEYRAPVPIVDMRILMTSPVGWANALAFLFGFMLFAGMIAIPAYVQSPRENGFGFGASIAETAVYLLPQTVMFLVVSLLASTMHRWPGSRPSIVIGVVLTVAGAAIFAFCHLWPVMVIMASGLMGLGIGLIYSHLMSVIVAAVPEGEVGSVSGMNTNMRNIGGAFGAQVCGAFLAIGGEAGFTVMFGAMTAVALLALVPATVIARDRGGPEAS